MSENSSTPHSFSIRTLKLFFFQGFHQSFKNQCIVQNKQRTHGFLMPCNLIVLSYFLPFLLNTFTNILSLYHAYPGKPYIVCFQKLKTIFTEQNLHISVNISNKICLESICLSSLVHESSPKFIDFTSQKWRKEMAGKHLVGLIQSQCFVLMLGLVINLGWNKIA